jgi:ATP-dependent Clp protease ATP-binding subunit ClpA
MYERFTVRARKVMQLANQEAQRFQHEYVGTEHILLGLMKEGSGVAANVLKSLDIDLRKIRLVVEQIVQVGPVNMVTPGKLPQTPRARQVIEYAIEEARNLNHNYVGTEHLLLGLLHEEEGVAAQVLLELGLRLDTICACVQSAMASPSYHEEQTPAESVQCLLSTGSPETNIQRAEEVDHLQDAPTPDSISGGLVLNSPDLDRLIARTGALGRAWNFLLGLVGLPRRELPTYQEPPGSGRYTGRARVVLHRSCVEAFWMRHEHLGTEHILLGLLNEGAAVRILERLGIGIQKVRSELRRIVQFGPELMPLPQVLPWTQRALRVLENACSEADRIKDEFVGTEHILLGLLSEVEGVGAQVLLTMGLTREMVREEIQRFLGQSV